LGVAICCLVGLPNLYDKFLVARFIATAIGLAILFLFALVGKKYWRVPHTPVFYVYLFFILFCGCSMLWATNTAEAIYAFANQLLTLLIINVFYSQLSTDGMFMRKALWTSAAVVLTVYLLVAVIQLFHVDSLSFSHLYSVKGLSGHKNLLAIMLLVLSSFLLTSFSIFENKGLKAFSVVMFVAAISVIVLLKSRAVLLGAFVAMGCFAVLLLTRSRHREQRKAILRHVIASEAWQSMSLDGFHRTAFVAGLVPPRNDAKRVKRRLRFAVVTSIVIVYAFLTVGLRWFADRSVPHTAEKSEMEHNILSTSSLAERCLLWDKTYQIADKHPLSGCGIGNWQILFPGEELKGLYRADLWNVTFTKPHNEYLGVLSETGYVGLLLFTIFVVVLVLRAFFVLLETGDRKDFLYGAIVLSVFVGVCVNALFDFPFSRVEHVVWMGVLMAILLKIITQRQHRTLGRGWNVAFLSLAFMLLVVGGFRLKGERNTFKMQQALVENNWKAVANHCQRAVSFFYTIDPVGQPMHWYLGKAEKQMGGQLQAISSFLKAHQDAPYCKENLNDLGLVEYYVAHDLDKAEHYLKEAIRISPNYVYPYFNLAYIYLTENQLQKAKEVADAIYFDAHKRDVMKADAVFFEPFNAEAARRKIDADYEASLQLRKTILDCLQKSR